MEPDRLLVVETDFNAYHLAFVRAGIRSYFEEGEHSVAYVNVGVVGLMQLFGHSVNERLWVIGILRTREAAEYFAERGIPCLNLADTGGPPSLGFDVRFEGEGALAAKYFFGEMNLKHAGFIGNASSRNHVRRLREFQHESKKRGVPVEVVQLPYSVMQRPFFYFDADLIDQTKEMIRGLLSRLGKPAGIFCGDDQIALHTYYCASVMGIKVPEEVSILGVGSRDSSKESWAQVVSVVQIDHQKLGFTAAKLMDEFVGKGEPPKSVRLKPSGICHSQTTFRRVVGDSVVREALRRIQQEPGISVLGLCEALDFSRPALDVRFRRATNMTVSRAIEIERFEQAKQLMAKNNYSLEAVASLAGFPNSRVMRRSFYRFCRMSPQHYRRLQSKEGK